MLYFNQLGIDPFADPDGDGLCNYSEYILGSNPTNAYSMSLSKTDAQYCFFGLHQRCHYPTAPLETNGPGMNMVTLTLSNTLVGSNYQIYSKDLAATNSAWRVETNFLSTNAATENSHCAERADSGLHRWRRLRGPDGRRPAERLRSPGGPIPTNCWPTPGNTWHPDGYKDLDGATVSATSPNTTQREGSG